MIELLIDNMPVDLPEGFSLDMEYENEFFTKASEYSLDIELPLLGSSNNRKIFGNINRMTIPKRNVNYEAVVYVNGRCVSHGYAIILSITNTIVKIQLVGNTSYVNFLGANTYIDEMDLGYAETPQFNNLTPTDWLTTAYINQGEYHKAFGSVDDTDMVFFWAYYKDPKDIVDSTFWPQRHPNSPFPTFPSSGDGSQIWLDYMYRYSCQPYLLKVIERIVSAMGFKLRRNDLNHTWLRNLYICNYKASGINGWDNTHGDSGGKKATFRLPMVNALPHWKVSTFLDEVEKLCACVFVFNTYNKTVDIMQLDKFYGDMASIYEIPDDCILDEYEFEFSEDSESKDLASGNISFARNYTDKLLKITQEVRDTIETHELYSNYDELLAAYEAETLADRKKKLFIDNATGREYICYVKEDGNDEMREVNVFCDLIRDEENGGSVELKIVPANTRLFNIGWFFDYAMGRPSAGLVLNVPFSEQEQTSNPEYKTAQEIIENSYSCEQKDEEDECMEVMLSTGEWFPLATYSGTSFSYPAPFTDFNMQGSANGKLPEMSLSLKDVCEQSLGHLYRNIPVYKSGDKFVIRFLAKTVPDARQPFLIHNQRYVCRKLSANFGDGMKELVFEGEFFRVG